MKNKQMRMVVLILIGLVLFTTSLALLLYSKQGDLEKQANRVQMVEVFLSAKDIKRGELIDAHSIKKGTLPKEYLGATPLTASEIIGRYARVDIFANEPLRKEKISLAQPKEEQKVVKVVENNTFKAAEITPELKDADTIVLPLSVFHNIDTSLLAGDTIDIVSVKSNKSGREVGFSANYIALGVKIKSFANNMQRAKGYIISSIEGKAVVANGIVLEVDPKKIKNFLNLYYETLALNQNRVYNKNNSGHLWMVKCAKEQTAETLKQKEKMLADYVAKVQYKAHKAVKRTQEVSISYEQ
ncbi:flagella basal body P-ring formation protein FlgA [Sulfurimonas microaerophilic]|uniref:flagella basal body P-ring formation protein FlgA n=1 Tax=Sulfurimonas microaerophilic TaxID=3058392 RepID=UPI0027152D83|nr:flagella basal body P-ring formation protein FlgA [Sulfurimonas sp. hsl 1-7]